MISPPKSALGQPNSSAIGWLRLLPILLVISIGCGKAEELTDSIPEPDPTPPPADPGDGVVQEDRSFVKVSNKQFPFYFHQSGDFTGECEIPATSTNEDIICHLHVNEGDLSFHGYSLNINTPPEICTYTAIRNYYYYNFEVGSGPPRVEIKKTYDADGNLTSTTCRTDSANAYENCSGIASSLTNEGVVYHNGDLACIYNHSLYGSGPNCCTGDYVHVSTEDRNGDVNSTVSLRSWGNSWDANCLGGPASLDHWPKTDFGSPSTQIYFTQEVGMNKTYNVPPAIKSDTNGGVGIGHNLLGANFYTGHPTIGSAPLSMNPGNDIHGNSRPTTQDSFELLCMDEAFEVMNRIRIYVQEWNTYSEFLTYGASAGASGNPNVTGDEGTPGDCSDEYDVSGSLCNDKGDWGDFPASYPQQLYPDRGVGGWG